MIKKWIQFLTESRTHEFGCVMIEIPMKDWTKITSVIDKDDVYVDMTESIQGIETDPHLTILYGLKKGTSLKDVKDKLSNYGPIEIQIDGVDTFESEKYEVVKFNVKKTKELEKMFKSISELPNENIFPNYVPHITISYVKKGSGKKYTKKVKRNLGKLSTLVFSQPSGKKYKFRLSEKSSGGE